MKRVPLKNSIYYHEYCNCKLTLLVTPPLYGAACLTINAASTNIACDKVVIAFL